MLFEGRYLSIPDAAEKNVQTVTALSNLNFLGAPVSLSEQVIAGIVSGTTDETLLAVTVDSGRRIIVTANHPLVDATGRIVFAADIVPGTRLSMVDGTDEVKGVERVPFSGRVWHILPKSESVAANILVAEGFLNGSIRYQDEWAEDESRLFLRHNVNLALD